MKEDNDFACLIAQMRQGSEEAARELFDRYGQYIIRAVRRLLSKKLRPRYDSQDFAQAVWASFFAIPADGQPFQNPEVLIAFLTRLARNKVIDAMRHGTSQIRGIQYEQALASQANQVPDTYPRPSQFCLAKDTWEHLLSRSKPHEQRILLLLRQGKNQREIARQTGITERTIHRLLQRLRLPSTPHEPEPASPCGIAPGHGR